MRKDIWKLIFWVLGLSVLFMSVVWATAQLTNINLIDSASAIHAIGILVAICLGGVFAYQRLQIFRTFEPHLVKSQDVVWEIINLFVLSSRSRLRELHLRQCFVVSR